MKNSKSGNKASITTAM